MKALPGTDHWFVPVLGVGNPAALSHLPCGVCGKPAREIGLFEGYVQIEVMGRSSFIKSRICAACSPPQAVSK